MKKFLRLLIFIMAFQMEVRVRASGDVMQQPSACLKSKESCTIHVTGPAFHLERGDFKMHASEDSTLMRSSANQWRLMKGTVWMEEAKNVEVETVFATVKASQGQYWLLDQGDKIVIRNIDAELEVTLRDGKKLEVPSGFEFWVAGLNSKNQNEYGMIRPIDMKEHLPVWNALYKGSKESFIKEVKNLKDNWGDMAEKSAAVYKVTTERKLAAVAEAERKETEKKRLEDQKRQELKNLYYQRTFER